MSNQKGFYCENCNKKYHGADASSFLQIIKSHIQKCFIKQLGESVDKNKTTENMQQKPLLKCSQCGYALKGLK